MEIPDGSLQEITEGRTRLLVPGGSLAGAAPPRTPAFFNPRARLNRDLSMAAYAAFLKKFGGARVMLECMSGVGARGLRAANELGIRAVINDPNPSAIGMARRSAALNGLEDVEFAGEDACRFFASRSKAGLRGAIVDVDPFGSPAPFLDCAIRATMHGGLLSASATDLQVLNGLFDEACLKKYGGVPVRTAYGNEVAIRLVLGCLWSVAARLGADVEPVFAGSEQHYYRVYAKIGNRPARGREIGYISHCDSCGHRNMAAGPAAECALCGTAVLVGGPLWTGRIFDGEFVQGMRDENAGLATDKRCDGILEKCLSEADMPGTYFTVDEAASAAGVSPPKLGQVISRLRGRGFRASATAFGPTGFRTDADMGQITDMLKTSR